MLIVMKANATEEQVRSVCEKIESLGFARTPFRERSAPPSASPATRRSSIPAPSTKWSGVQEVIRVSKPYKLVSRDLKEENTVVRFPNSDATIGGEEVAVMAGPAPSRAASRRWPPPNACPRRSALLPRRRLQAAHLALLVSGTG